MRRLVHHIALASLCSPLVGGVGVALRARRAGSTRAAWLAGALAVIGSMVFVLGVAVGPWDVATTRLVALAWLAACGAVVAGIERRAGLLPAEAIAPETWRDVVGWGLTFPICWSPLAILLATFTSRWGMELFFKPSLAAEVAWAAMIWLLPLGLIFGSLRWWQRRSRAPGAFAAVAVALPVSFLALALGVVAVAVLLDDVLDLSEVDPLPWLLAPTSYLALDVAMLVLALLWITDWLVGARAARAFLSRALLVAGLAVVATLNQQVLDLSLWLQVVDARAERAERHGGDVAAARLLLRAAGRAPLASNAARTVERAAVAALVAGDGERFAAAMVAARATVAGRSRPALELARTVAALDSSRDLNDLVRVRVEPVIVEPWLGSAHATVLTAAHAALPEVAESTLKQRLREISLSADGVSLDDPVDYVVLTVMADVLGVDVVPIAAAALEAALATERPVLHFDPQRRTWSLLTASAPGMGVIEWLDYDIAKQSHERRLDQKEVARLVASEERGDDAHDRVYGEIRRLGARSRFVGEACAMDCLLAVLVVAAERHEVASLGEGAPTHELLLATALARRAADRSGWTLARARALTLPPGPAREEILALASIGERRWSEDAIAELMATRVESNVLDQPLESRSAWGLEALCETARVTPDIPCETVRQLVIRLADLEPLDWSLQRQRLELEVGLGHAAAAGVAALRFAHAAGWHHAEVLEAVSRLAPMVPTSGDSGEWQSALRELISTIPRLVEDAGPMLRKHHGGWHAAQAVLASDPTAAATHWTEASLLELRNPEFHAARGRALRSLGELEQAAAAEGLAQQLRGASECGVELEVCRPIVRRPLPSEVEEN